MQADYLNHQGWIFLAVAALYGDNFHVNPSANAPAP